MSDPPRAEARFVVVVTDIQRRTVFGGFFVSDDGQGRLVLRDAQNCHFWSKETRGVLGLAAHGPQKGSRIGPPVPRLEIDGVTTIIDATDEARVKWQEQTWSE